MTADSYWLQYVADNLFDGADPSDGELVGLQKAFKAGYAARLSEDTRPEHVEEVTMELKDFLKDLMCCMEPIRNECLCDEIDEEDPRNHSDYCPVYLYDYCRRVLDGED